MKNPGKVQFTARDHGQGIPCIDDIFFPVCPDVDNRQHRRWFYHRPYDGNSGCRCAQPDQPGVVFIRGDLWRPDSRRPAPLHNGAFQRQSGESAGDLLNDADHRYRPCHSHDGYDSYGSSVYSRTAWRNPGISGIRSLQKIPERDSRRASCFDRRQYHLHEHES